MDFLPLIVGLVLIGLLFFWLRRMAADRKEAEQCLTDNQEKERFWQLAQKKSQRILQPDIRYYDLLVRGAWVQGDLQRMEQLLTRMNKTPAPRQLDYLLGLDQFLFYCAKSDYASASQSLEYCKQVLDSNAHKKLDDRLAAYEFVLHGRLSQNLSGHEQLERRVELPDDDCIPVEKGWLCYEWCCVMGQTEDPARYNRYWSCFLTNAPGSFLEQLPLPKENAEGDLLANTAQAKDVCVETITRNDANHG